MNSLGGRSDSKCEMLRPIHITNSLFREFAESTILTIAHRLRTVIDYDRVSYSPRFAVSVINES
jgi:hypothetical protein